MLNAKKSHYQILMAQAPFIISLMFVTQQQKISETERLVTHWVTKIGFLGTSFYPKSVKKKEFWQAT